MSAHTPTDNEIVSAMVVYGGGFVKSLAESFRRADEINFARLKAAFPDLWEKYTRLAVARPLAEGRGE